MADGTPTIGHNSGSVGQMLAQEPAALYSDPALLDSLLSEIESEIEEFEVDLESVTGRKAVASLAYGIAQTKSALDTAGKVLNGEHREAIDRVDSVRRNVRNQLDILKAKARKPLDDWEAHEKAVKAETRATYEKIEYLGQIMHGYTSEEIGGRIEKLKAFEIDTELIGNDEVERITKEVEHTLQRLQIAFDKEVEAEADRAELARIKAEREAEEQARKEAEAKAAAEQAEADRLEKLKQQAAEDAQREAEAEAKAKVEEAERKQREAEQALADKKAEEDRIASEAEAREQDRKHRSAVMKAAKEAIMEHGDVKEAQAKAIVLAIGANSIPNISINF